ncbi:MAG TPA: 4-(cytidine 5'-diphospho)-2-C-methyl-D-erythritol kinase [Myxococcota bacterium]|nr:4-(cytidine 5'-diphospho)-2-C-methyl-D-erythritol kinase [Myxococcota bacterium]
MSDGLHNCYAKLNLCLHVGPRRKDGFHELGSVVVPIPWADELSVDVKKGCGRVSLELGKSHIKVPNDESNLAFKAAVEFLKLVGSDYDIHIKLTKKVPIGAGLAGGSADGGHVLRILNDLTGKPLDTASLIKLASQLGSDCPFFIDPKPVWMSGRGEKLVPLTDLGCILPPLYLVVAIPDISLSTAEIFRLFDQRSNNHSLLTQRGTCAIHPCLLARGDSFEAPVFYNDLAEVVFEISLQSRVLRDALLDAGAYAASVTGAGSAVFGVFDTPERADAAATRIGSADPGVITEVFWTAGSSS